MEIPDNPKPHENYKKIEGGTNCKKSVRSLPPNRYANIFKKP